jgi:HEAT repeat protein
MKTQTLTVFVTIAAALGATPALAQTVTVTAPGAAQDGTYTVRHPAVIAPQKGVDTIYTAQHPVTIAQSVAETVAAAQRAAEDARQAVWTLAGDARFAAAWDQQSDRDREMSRAQREKEDAQREKERAQRDRDRENSYYDQGQSALDSARWDRAVTSFDRVIEAKSNKADAALYWKAYAQNKQGQRPEALATIGVLLKEYPKSRYLSDAKALEVEVKQRSGQPVNPAAEADEDLKLVAIQALANNPSEEAIPILQKVLQGTGSPRLKARALFVLAQSSSPKAREVLVNIAKGNANPDLQMKAVQYLAIHGGRESRAALAEIYSGSSEIDMKKSILRAFMQGGEKDRLVTAATSEQNAELRATAVSLLGNMSATDELWTLYQKESSVDVKKQIIRALFTGGSATRLIELAKSEQNPELRLLSVRNLGVMNSKRTGDTLAELYGTEKDPDIRKAIINGLFVSNNAEALIALARKEQDPAMKKEMVSRLSNMHGSKAVTDFLLEILNK